MAATAKRNVLLCTILPLGVAHLWARILWDILLSSHSLSPTEFWKKIGFFSISLAGTVLVAQAKT